MAVLAGNTHPLQNRVQCPHKAEYIILGNPGQLSRPAVASTSQLYPCGTLLQLFLRVCTSIHLWEINWDQALLSEVGNQPPRQRCHEGTLLIGPNLEHLGSDRCR